MLYIIFKYDQYTFGVTYVSGVICASNWDSDFILKRYPSFLTFKFEDEPWACRKWKKATLNFLNISRPHPRVLYYKTRCFIEAIKMLSNFTYISCYEYKPQENERPLKWIMHIDTKEYSQISTCYA